MFRNVTKIFKKDKMEKTIKSKKRKISPSMKSPYQASEETKKKQETEKGQAVVYEQIEEVTITQHSESCEFKEECIPADKVRASLATEKTKGKQVAKKKEENDGREEKVCVEGKRKKKTKGGLFQCLFRNVTKVFRRDKKMKKTSKAEKRRKSPNKMSPSNSSEETEKKKETEERQEMLNEQIAEASITQVEGTTTSKKERISPDNSSPCGASEETENKQDAAEWPEMYEQEEDISKNVKRTIQAETKPFSSTSEETEKKQEAEVVQECRIDQRAEVVPSQVVEDVECVHHNESQESEEECISSDGKRLSMAPEKDKMKEVAKKMPSTDRRIEKIHSQVEEIVKSAQVNIKDRVAKRRIKAERQILSHASEETETKQEAEERQELFKQTAEEICSQVAEDVECVQQNESHEFKAEFILDDGRKPFSDTKETVRKQRSEKRCNTLMDKRKEKIHAEVEEIVISAQRNVQERIARRRMKAEGQSSCHSSEETEKKQEAEERQELLMKQRPEEVEETTRAVTSHDTHEILIMEAQAIGMSLSLAPEETGKKQGAREEQELEREQREPVPAQVAENVECVQENESHKSKEELILADVKKPSPDPEKTERKLNAENRHKKLREKRRETIHAKVEEIVISAQRNVQERIARRKMKAEGQSSSHSSEETEKKQEAEERQELLMKQRPEEVEETTRAVTSDDTHEILIMEAQAIGMSLSLAPEETGKKQGAREEQELEREQREPVPAQVAENVKCVLQNESHEPKEELILTDVKRPCLDPEKTERKLKDENRHKKLMDKRREAIHAEMEKIVKSAKRSLEDKLAKRRIQAERKSPSHVSEETEEKHEVEEIPEVIRSQVPEDVECVQQKESHESEKECIPASEKKPSPAPEETSRTLETEKRYKILMDKRRKKTHAEMEKIVKSAKRSLEDKLAKRRIQAERKSPSHVSEETEEKHEVEEIPEVIRSQVPEDVECVQQKESHESEKECIPASEKKPSPAPEETSRRLETEKRYKILMDKRRKKTHAEMEKIVKSAKRSLEDKLAKRRIQAERKSPSHVSEETEEKHEVEEIPEVIRSQMEKIVKSAKRSLEDKLAKRRIQAERKSPSHVSEETEEKHEVEEIPEMIRSQVPEDVVCVRQKEIHESEKECIPASEKKPSPAHEETSRRLETEKRYKILMDKRRKKTHAAENKDVKKHKVDFKPGSTNKKIFSSGTELEESLASPKKKKCLPSQWAELKKPNIIHSAQEQKALRAAFRSLFNLYSRQWDDTIDLIGIRSTLKHVGIKLRDRDSRGALLQADIDGDGKVNFQDFLKVMTDPRKFCYYMC
ncbi:trichohyalin-like [Protopterus annectens]|uniref:trichohyalin-like n=1 Tax=Protopterus annectens TaxID=7888 RepID=UPI001CF9D45D|nr:trichohyalin-like [Protopterus annectens]